MDAHLIGKIIDSVDEGFDGELDLLAELVKIPSIRGQENTQIYDELTARGDRLRNGFNQHAREKGWPALMTGVGSMFQTHLQDSPVTGPREMLGRLDEPLGDLQLYLRYNGVFIPWLHLAFISAAHSDEDIEEVLKIHQVSVEACLTAHNII